MTQATDPKVRARRNVRLALAHVAVVLLILGFFVYSQARA